MHAIFPIQFVIIIVLEEEAKKMPKRKVPKGTSEYQAAWILDSEEEEDGSDVSRQDDYVH